MNEVTAIKEYKPNQSRRIPELKMYNLGFVGHHAQAFQALFGEYSMFPNEAGYSTCFENYTELVVNKGVMVVTNSFATEEDFVERLNHKLMYFFINQQEGEKS